MRRNHVSGCVSCLRGTANKRECHRASRRHFDDTRVLRERVHHASSSEWVLRHNVIIIPPAHSRANSSARPVRPSSTPCLIEILIPQVVSGQEGANTWRPGDGWLGQSAASACITRPRTSAKRRHPSQGLHASPAERAPGERQAAGISGARSAGRGITGCGRTPLGTGSWPRGAADAPLCPSHPPGKLAACPTWLPGGGTHPRPRLDRRGGQAPFSRSRNGGAFALRPAAQETAGALPT